MKSGQGIQHAQATQDAAVETYIQFEAAMNDLQYGRCEIAQTRLEFVVKSNPLYPGITEALTKAMLCSNATATPQPVVQPTAVPTPETRDASQIMAEAETLYAAQDWENLIYQLDAIRNNYPDVEPIRVDQMYYTAYRQIGIKVLLQQGDLEGGIYNFTLASKYGPLDAEAQNYSQWASWYLTGMSFWEVDWGQALNIFNKLPMQPPTSGTVNIQLSKDMKKQGNTTVNSNRQSYLLFRRKRYCAAQNTFNIAREYTTFDEQALAKSSEASQKCAENPDSQPQMEYPY